jgi:serine/threonine protein kinase/thiol-disulfide isomerase/thioredoxin
MGTEHANEEEIFRNAIQFENRDEQASYVKKACGGDFELCKAIEELLHHHYASSILDAPAFEAGLFDENTVLTEGPGAMVGRYKLLEKIGEGGMAVVYMAEQHEPIRRKVALKIIKVGMDTRQVIARFEAERQALAIMDYPNIAKVLDAGATETGRPYFVMELVSGVSITEYCDKNNLSAKERLALFVQVCEAVQHAHQKGIIHRDIKPSNVMVTQHERTSVPKVIDFGIAKAINQQLTEKTLFTQYAHIVGTPAYMSPEQAQLSDLDVDTRTDIYSLGVLLYELLTGTTPFGEEKLRKAGYLEMQRIIREEEPTKPSTRLTSLGDTLTDVAKHRSSTPELLRKTVRGDLDWIVMKALEKQRDRRYDTASELSADIDRHLNHEPVRAAAPSLFYKTRKFARRNRSLVAGVLAVLAVFIMGFVISTALYIEAERSHRQEAAARTEADRLRIKEALQRRDAEVERDKAQQAEKLAEQRRNEATVARDEAERQANISEAMVRFLKSAIQLDLSGSAVSGMDLEHLAGSRSLRSLSVPETHIADADLVHLRDVASLEGLFLGKTQVTDAGLANLKDITALRALCVHGTQVGDSGLAFLKNLHSLQYLCLSNTKVSDAGLVQLRGLNSLQDLRLAGTQVTETGINELRQYLPNCRILGPDASTVYAPTQAPADGRLPERRRLVASGWKASWSPDGTRLAFGRGQDKGLQILNLQTNEMTDLTSFGKDPAWSPDGRFIAYVQGVGSSEEILLVKSSGESPRKLMEGGYPSWSPDGKILYVHSRKENKIFAIAVDEPDAKPEVFFGHPQSWYPAISPDGKRIAMGRKDALILVDRQTGHISMTWPTPDHHGLLPAWSPDGRLVAFGGIVSEPFGVWVLNVESREAIQVADGPYTMPAWSNDGTKLAFDLRSEDVREIWMVQTETIRGRKPSDIEAARFNAPPAPSVSQRGSSDTAPEEISLIGKPAPAFTQEDANGRQVSLADFKGKVVLLDFWATWCQHCVKAIPHLESLHKKYSQEGLMVIGLNNEPNQDKVRQFAQGWMSYLSVSGMDRVFREYGVEGVPSFFYVDREGKVRYHETGFSDGKESRIEARVRELLGLDLVSDEGYYSQTLRASEPSPATASDIGPEPSVELRWRPASDAVVQRVYFGPDAQNLALLAEVRGDNTLNFPKLEKQRWYCWRVDTVRSDGSVVEGELWSFSTGDLVGWWQFDETEGRTAADSSGRGHHGSLIGNPQWQPGRIGGALTFDGLNDYVSIKDAADFDITKEITVACWVNVAKFDIPWQAIIAKGNQAWRIIRAQSGKNIEFACTGVSVPNTIWGNVFGKTVVDDGQWHHLAGIYGGKRVCLYVDGVLDTSIEGAGNLNSNDDYVLIGANAGDQWRYWRGLIDDVRVYSYALSEEQIKELYAGRGPGPNIKPVGK